MRNLSVTQKLLISYVVLVVAVMALSVALLLPREIDTMERNLEESLSRIAYILAHDREIIDGLNAGGFSKPLCEKLDGIFTLTNSNVDYIVVADTNSIRFYHPKERLIGQKFVGGDEEAVIAGRSDKYVTTWKGDPDVQKRAFHSVRDDDGKILGFVMASTSTQNIEFHKQQLILEACGFLGFALIAGLFLAYGISCSIRRILLGYDPTTFAKMYLQREEILDKLNEGILVINEEKKIIYKNLPAHGYIKRDAMPEQSPLYPEFADCLRKNTTVTWSTVELADKSFLVSMIPLRPLENLDAVMLVLHNRTEFVFLTEQLTGLNHIVEALRTNTHEFRNKLHIIYGLLQLGDVKQAMKFISEEASTKSGQNILRLIQDKTVAALLLGKANRAVEINIDFVLRRDSNLPEKNPFLSTKELALVIGNLIENSFEAMTDVNLRQVEIFIFGDDQSLTITVDDTGVGIDSEAVSAIHAGNYTTKGLGHGYGLRLIREVVDRHGGFLQIDSEIGMGTSITVNFNKSGERTGDNEVGNS